MNKGSLDEYLCSVADFDEYINLRVITDIEFKQRQI